MAIIETINSAINGVVWGVPMLVLLVGAGILLTIRTFGVQFRKFGYAMKNTLGKVFTKTEAKEGEMTPFQAMSTALAGTVGTGNIAGITTAITLGGPGTMLWLWITALIGMATKYSEVLLAVKFRERNKDGDWVGGPMYYIKNGLGKNWKWLGAIFCIFAALAAFGIGNAVQVGNITSSINTVITAFNPDFDKQSLVNIVLGIILVILTSVVLFGGIKRLGAVTEKLVEAGVRVALDDDNQKIGYKIRAAQQVDRVPYMLVLGAKEAEAGNISVRDRKGETTTMDLDAFIAKVTDEIKNRSYNA